MKQPFPHTMMICKIADFFVDVPVVGDMRTRCADYQYDGTAVPDIVIPEEKLKPDREPTLSRDKNYYLETGYVFHRMILPLGGFMLHSSAVSVDGKAFLFSGPSGMGKSTHTGKYLKTFGDRAFIINDDKPVIRKIDGTWYAYGTPWAGKFGINRNARVPIAGICFLRRGERKLTRLTMNEAMCYLLAQSHSNYSKQNMGYLLSQVDAILREVPMFEFRNSAEDGDELLTWKAMCDAAGTSGFAAE